MQQKNLLLFFVLSMLLVIGWYNLERYIWPPPPKPDRAAVASKGDAEKPKGDDKKKAEDKKPAEKKADKKPEPPAAVIRPVNRTPLDKLIVLGEKNRDSKFHLYLVLDPFGAGWRSLICNKFQAADNDGLPLWANEEKTQPLPMELVPASATLFGKVVAENIRSPSFRLYAFDVNAPTDDKPLDTLGRINWTPGEKKIETLPDQRRRESVSFQAESQGVLITKTFSLTEGEYHVGLEVKMRLKDQTDKNGKKVRYQLAGAHGLPVEGKWYTGIFRNALIARVDKDTGDVYRDLQDLRQISHWGGGNEVLKEGKHLLTYAGVADQYFASMIVVDNDQPERGFLHQARPTLETALTKGTVMSVAEDGSSFVLKLAGGTEETFYVPEDARLSFLGLGKGARIAVLHHTAPFDEKANEYPEIATAHFPEDAVPPLWVEDITVRVATEPVELKGASEVVHKYLLYNGPVKVNQLTGPPGLTEKPLEQGGVDAALVARYHDDLHLNTLTDYHSPGAMGSFASAIYWTALVIKCTNLMHAVLAYIHVAISNYGLCIIVLTVLVRGLMFPLSRKQALMSLRMQELAPELKRLQERYRDDRQALGMAQMDLYRRHGVNPLGSCWVLLLQMPIFMGLYFALQESVHFRLEPFWPTWITNLAAPDMLFGWSQHIPFISRVEDYGSFLYLGPYFNLLPVIAVALMIAQQKMMTPPPTDEQQAMQQKMMKYMMIFFGLMFYKVAAGLCLYFIASSVWGFCERKLLPKKKPEIQEVSGEGYFQRLLRRARAGEHVTTAPSATSTSIRPADGGITTTPALEPRGRTGGKRGRNKRRPGQADVAGTSAENGSLLGRWRKQLREWWIAVLKEAEKKNRS